MSKSIPYYTIVNIVRIVKNVLKILGRSSLKNNIHFLSIDKRIVKNNNLYSIR